MSVKTTDPKQIGAVQEDPAFTKLLLLLKNKNNRIGDRAHIVDNDDALRLVVNIRNRTKAAYHNIAAALGTDPHTGVPLVSSVSLSTLVKRGVTEGLVVESRKRGTPHLRMKRAPGDQLKSLLGAAAKARLAKQPLLPGIDPVPRTAPAKAPVAAQDPLPPTAPVVTPAPSGVAVVLDPSGTPAAEILGDLCGLAPTVLWCTDAAGRPVRLRVVVP